MNASEVREDDPSTRDHETGSGCFRYPLVVEDLPGLQSLRSFTQAFQQGTRIAVGVKGGENKPSHNILTIAGSERDAVHKNMRSRGPLCMSAVRIVRAHNRARKRVSATVVVDVAPILIPTSTKWGIPCGEYIHVSPRLLRTLIRKMYLTLLDMPHTIG